jgi:hypothetical protein
VTYAVSIVTIPGYVHSEAFREVAETVHHGLLALGHDSVLTSSLRVPGRRHIVLGSNLLPRAGATPEPGSILYNLEQIQPGSPWMSRELLGLFRRYPVWDYSAANAERLAALGVPPPRVVPIGFVPELARIPPAPVEDIDVLHYGSANDRRRRVLAELQARGARVVHVFGVYGAQRDALIARARVVLNLHYYEAKVFEIVRVSYLLANRRCVVSETGCDPREEAELAAGVAFADYGDLAGRCLSLLDRPDERRRYAEAGHELMARRPAAEILRAALEGTS